MPLRRRARPVHPEGAQGFHRIEGRRRVRRRCRGLPARREYDPTAEIGSRVVSILVDGSEVVPEGLYTICTTDYLAKGGDGNTALTGYAYAGVGDNAMALSMYLLRLEVIKESDIQMGRQTAVEVFDAQNSLMEVVEA
ncbi:MAG: 5'-nucleotidase C-terminal domain-containing protein [Candidatus Methanomethylophilaceae archaeon]|nr:5'-nucleotidase C-terminal domain-containing protein [Candidatus Methanomethylophilaceae archaeon]